MDDLIARLEALRERLALPSGQQWTSGLTEHLATVEAAIAECKSREATIRECADLFPLPSQKTERRVILKLLEPKA